MQGSVEMRLEEFIESKWFKGLARGAMIVTPLILAGFALAWTVVTGNTAADLSVAKAKMESLAASQMSRAADSEDFQKEVRGQVDDLQTDLHAIKDDVVFLRVDVGVIKRLLQDDMDVASAVPR